MQQRQKHKETGSYVQYRYKVGVCVREFMYICEINLYVLCDESFDQFCMFGQLQKFSSS